MPFDPGEAHAVGELLADASTSDLVDAHVALIAGEHEVLTSDPDDLQHLADHLDPAPSVRRV